MHIPDGFLNAGTAAAAAAVSAAGLAIAVPRLQTSLPRSKVPLLGLTAAFVFSAQMLNFPVGGGTSGHLVGSVLVAVLLGPAAAVLVLTTVLLVQCFLFADGGVTALGANVFNMALVAPVVGHWIFRAIRREGSCSRSLVLGAAFAAWCSIVLAAVSCAGQLALSGMAPWNITFPTMASIHMIIGLGEGLITALVLVALARVRPDLLALDALPATRPSTAVSWGLGLTVTVGLLLFVAPFASPLPDGLEKVAGLLGFEHHAEGAAAFAAPATDYLLPGLNSPVAATALAGLLGALLVFVLSWLLARLLLPNPEQA